jgi:hypothetical protein
MFCMFLDTASFNQPLAWDVSQVMTMFGMFDGATSFNQLLSWDVSRVTNMLKHDHRCKVLKISLAQQRRQANRLKLLGQGVYPERIVV